MSSGWAGKTAVWTITESGVELGRRISENLAGSDLFIPSSFKRLSESVSERFKDYEGHIFIMAAGIVVRIIAPLIINKMKDPAVVVVDETASSAIALLSGHIGGANELARRVAEITGARPVITTATDVRNLPSVDLLAKDAGLVIENPERIKTVNMAILERRPVCLFDPFALFPDDKLESIPWNPEEGIKKDRPLIFISDIICRVPDLTLILRPKSLSVGVGCNRGTPEKEITGLIEEVFEKDALSTLSIQRLASIDIKKDEKGLLESARRFESPVEFYSREELNRQMVPNPSKTVEKHIGAKSVCEAAAILASRKGRLIIEKRRSENVTIAVARSIFLSSE